MKPLDPQLLRNSPAVRWHVLRTAGLGALSSLALIGFALSLADVVTAVAIQGQGWESISRPFVAAIVLIGVRFGLGWLMEHSAEDAAWAAIAQLRARLLQHLADLGPAHLGRSQVAPITTVTATGLDALEPYLTRYLPQLVLSAVVTPILVVAVTWADPISGLILVLTLPLIPLFMALVGLATQAQAERKLARVSAVGAQVLDLVAGLATLRALGRARAQVRRVREVSQESAQATMATLRTAFLSALVLELLTTLAVAIVAVAIGLRLLHGELDLRTGLMVLVLAPEVYLPLRQVGVHFHASADGLAAANAAFELLALPVPAPGTETAPDLAQTTIVLRDVSVRYGTDPGRPATPHQLSLRIEPGQVTGLRGPNGSGKSTTAAVVLGLLRPTGGQVALEAGDGSELNLNDVSPASWRTQISWVPQHPLIVPGTVRENVRFGAPRATDEDLATAARLCGLAQVVATLPQGWDTPIGQGGLGLSAGQRQRIAVARALVGEAQLVVLDEPTAHLDAASERDVLSAVTWLRAMGRTVLLIAHRESTLALADQIVDLAALTELTDHAHLAGDEDLTTEAELQGAR